MDCDFGRGGFQLGLIVRGFVVGTIKAGQPSDCGTAAVVAKGLSC